MSNFSSENIAQNLQWGEDSTPRNVVITHLEMFSPPHETPAKVPAGVGVARAEYATPELVRWLYSVVGGPYRWYERLGWSREDWHDELCDAGSEIWLLTFGGTPAGYCQLHAEINAKGSTETEILYFGLMNWAQGQGFGKVFLQQMLQHAWDLDARHPLPPVSRVWVHTCDLDGEHALDNYQGRGLVVSKRETYQEVVLKEPLSSWDAMFAH